MNEETKKRLKFIIVTSSIGLVIMVVGITLAFKMYDTKEGTNELIINPVSIGNVPILEIYIDDNAYEKPMIILQHGFKNKKEAMIKLGEELANEGFFVIAPDAYAHGERNESPMSLVEIIVETSQEYDELIEFYQEDNRVNVNELGLSGFSMGGCICFHYAVNGQFQPDVMAPTITTPYFEQLIGTDLGKSIYNSEQGVKVEENIERIEEINKFIVESSPFSDYVDLLGIDMLIQNGADDKYVTSEGVEKLEKVLETLENPDCTVEFISVPNMKHKVNDEMKENIVDFMCQNLTR